MQAPDVLWIYTDQWRWDALGCVGGEAVTPVIDRLAADGVRFELAVAQSPVCMPSRASALTGRYPSTLGITRNGIPVLAHTTTLADHLGSRGWHTATIGKLHFEPHANRDDTLPRPSYGFETVVVSDEPGVYDDDYRAWVRSIEPRALDAVSVGLPPAAADFERILATSSAIRHPGAGARDDYDDAHVFAADDSLTHTAWVATRTIEHLAALPSDQPAFTIASFFAPHAPYRVPQGFYDLYDRARLAAPSMTEAERDDAVRRGFSEERLRALRNGYLAAISEVDHHVGRLLDSLARTGRAERTLVVVTSDHGEWLGDHGRLGKGFPADDPVSRVPLILRWPPFIQAPGRAVTTVVEMLDLVPTILEACGVPVPSDLQGRSLMAALRDHPIDRLEVAITEHDDWTSLRSPHHHYLVRSDGTERLWDLQTDPHEHQDIAQRPEAGAVLAEHRLLLLRRLLMARRNLPRPWPY